MKNILLISGTTHSEDSSPIDGSSSFGLMRIGSYLQDKNVPVSLVRSDESDLLKKIEEYDIIGLSGLSIHANELYALSRLIKEKFPGKTIVGGSEHFALDYEWILKNPEKTGVDVVCTGQGERTMLELSKGTNLESIGSVAYIKDGLVEKTEKYQVLSERSTDPLQRPISVKKQANENTVTVFPEFRNIFDKFGNTQTGSGCAYACNFCTNGPFMGQRYTPNLETAIEEVNALEEDGHSFVFVRDAMANGNKKNFSDFKEHMKNNSLYWYGFHSVDKSTEEDFQELADSGCLMIGVGIEDVVGDRRNLGKGLDLENTISFLDKAKEQVMVRSLMIMGLPSHYNFSREEIKSRTLEFMLENPQSAYRLNLWTPLLGTGEFDTYKDCLTGNPREDETILSKMNTMENIIDPKKMYDQLGIPEDKRWIQSPEDLVELRNEIMLDYLESSEHRTFVESIKESKSPNRDKIYEVTKTFTQDNLGRYRK